MFARYSRRDGVLAVLAMMWIFRGATIATSANPGARFGNITDLFPAVLASPWSSLPWIAAGCFGLIAAATRRVVGAFALLTLPPMAWTGLYLWTWAGSLGGGDPVAESNWAPAGFCLFMAGITVYGAGADARRRSGEQGAP